MAIPNTLTPGTKIWYVERDEDDWGPSYCGRPILEVREACYILEPTSPVRVWFTSKTAFLTEQEAAAYCLAKCVEHLAEVQGRMAKFIGTLLERNPKSLAVSPYAK